MTKKHFIALANTIKVCNASAYKSRHFSVLQCVELAAFCREQNPRFNSNRWMSYINNECGPNGGKVKP